jgi:hypothetical protein
VNDYLTNLASRSLNPTPALRPRPRSRFEPVSLGGAQPLAATPDRIALDVEAPEVESAPPVVTGGVPGRRASALIARTEDKNESVAPPRGTSTYRSPGNIETSPNADSATGMPAQPQLTILRPEPVRRFQPASHAAADRGAALDQSSPETVESKGPETAAQPSRREPSRRKPSGQKKDEESPRPLRDLQLQTVIREQVVINEVLQRSEPERSGPENRGAEAESLLPASKRPATSSPIIAQPRVTPLFEHRSDQKIGRGDEKAAPPAPTIHVTIGRVEVRATHSTSPSTPKPRPARPTMSLDDYLRRRGDGGAR